MKQIKLLLLLASGAVLLGGCSSYQSNLGSNRIRTAYALPAESAAPALADVGWTLSSAAETK